MAPALTTLPIPSPHLEDKVGRAVEAYQSELERHLTGTEGAKKPSLRRISLRFDINHNTLSNRLKGMPSLVEFNAQKSHLTDAESRVLLDMIVCQGRRGFPLDYKLIEDYANYFLRQKDEPGYGPSFLGVGSAWTPRWMKQYECIVSMYWSTSLETVRANALTPSNVGHWFQLYLTTVEEADIPPARRFQMDEVGILLGVGRKKRVAGPAGCRVQYSQRSGNRELVTMLPTICGDGTYIRPTVIFKGKNLSRECVENNPLGCSWVT